MKGFCSWEKHIKTDQYKGLKPRRTKFRAHPYSQAALHQLEAPGPGPGRSGTPSWSSLAWEVPILGPVSSDQSTKDLPGSTISATVASNDDDNGAMSLPQGSVPPQTTSNVPLSLPVSGPTVPCMWLLNGSSGNYSHLYLASSQPAIQGPRTEGRQRLHLQ
ncbi:hypothetical protein B0H14DRAFT_241454 [Mycena olivaceomarginata]|nr:hypothetical protein B0H14DRAFT_241454 [Mycena olivaceomarginata]